MPARLTVPALIFCAGALTLALPTRAQESFIIDVPARAPASAPAIALPAPARPIGLARPSHGPIRQQEQPTLKVTPLDGNGERPDESALRYYVTLNQTTRANVEIQRLARLYPGWVPPVDLFDMDMSSRDEDMFWDLFAADKIPELHAAMDARRREDPGWQPSRDLATKLRRKELRFRIESFWKEGRWQDLVDFIKGDGIESNTDVDLLWTVAEAYGRTKQAANAASTYRTILESSEDPPARLATIQKAMATLRMADVEPLIALGRTRADGTSEFQPIMVDIVRSRISAYLHDERPAPVPPAELAVFHEYARKAEDPNQPGLMAWYYYKIKAYRDALEWFKLALERGGDAMIAHGLAHSLRALSMWRETEEVAYAWREPLVNNLILFIDVLERDLTLENPPFIEPERLGRYARVTMDVASGEGAQALGWYAYNSCQYPVALEWFQRAMAWFPKEATAYGYALTLKKLKRQKEFLDVVNRWDGLFPKVVEIIFPDGLYHPPTPCDIQAAMQLAPTQQQVQGVGQSYVVPGATPNMAAGYDPRLLPQGMVRPGAPAIAPPQAYGALRPPKIDPKEFPIAVDPENPLRYAAVASGPRPGAPAPPIFPPPILREPFRLPRPLVANRVPGVGAMPYERYGFALLPGWTGQTAASNPTHTAQIAPAGTLWSSELDEKDRPRTAGLAGTLPPAQAPTSVPVSVPTSVPAAMPAAPAASPRAPESIIAAAPMPQTPAVAAPASAAPPLGVPSASDARAWNAASARPVLPATTDVAALAQRAQQFFNEKHYADAIEALDQRAPLAPETTDLRMLRGWSLLHLKRAEEARRVFADIGPKPAAPVRPSPGAAK